MKAQKNFELISIDHDTRFFPYLAESVIREFTGKGSVSDLKISWQKGIDFKKVSFRDLLRRHKQLKSSTIDWQIVSGNKRIQYAERFNPSFDVLNLKVIKNTVKLLLVTLSYWVWILFQYRKNSKEDVFFNQNQSGDFTDFFSKKPHGGCLNIESNGMSVKLCHIPEL